MTDLKMPIIPAINAYDISQLRQSTTETTFERVCSYVTRKIQTAATLGNQDTIAIIPDIISDVPSYDTKLMTLAMAACLSANGYWVVQMDHTTLYISWRNPVIEPSLHEQETV
jgi:hypothetical protein